jgi:hypothetical protein
MQLVASQSPGRPYIVPAELRLWCTRGIDLKVEVAD